MYTWHLIDTDRSGTIDTFLYITMTSPNITFDRSYGTRHIDIGAGEVVTAISQPDWQQVSRSLGELAGLGAGTVITTPELSTSTDIPLADIANARGRIEDRIAEAADRTRAMPDALLLLGSAVFDAAVAKPRNAVVFLQDGTERGRSYKQSPIGKQERLFLDTGRLPGDILKPLPRILNVICSDLTDMPPLDPTVDTVLVSACWGTPTGFKGVPASPDHRHVQFISYLVDDLFDRHHNLQTVVMTDRAHAGSAYNGPFNFVAQR
jgi:hypothetical protein